MTIDDARAWVNEAMERDPLILRGWELRGIDPLEGAEKLAAQVLRVELELEKRCSPQSVVVTSGVKP